MPTPEENVKYLYLVLTYGGAPEINWDPICTALDINKSAATKRWSRLKQAMENGGNSGPSAYQILWLCIKHSKRTTPPDWDSIADACNTTPGAASKRYSRMKRSFEQDGAPPGTSPRSPVKNTPTKPKVTPKKTKTTSEYGVEAMPTPKRKRSTPGKKTPIPTEEQKFKPEPEDDDEDFIEDVVPKRPKFNATPKPKGTGNSKTKSNTPVKKEKDLLTPTTEASTIIRPELHDANHDTFYDTHEYVDDVDDYVDDDVEEASDMSADTHMYHWLATKM